MPKNLTVTLSDMEYEILKKINVVEGEDGEKLRNLLRLYISTIPGLKSAEYALKRVENKEEIDSLLRDVWAAYELTDNPTETWKNDKIDKLMSDLIEINVLVKTGEKQFIPTSKFRNLFSKMNCNLGECLCSAKSYRNWNTCASLDGLHHVLTNLS